MRVFVMELTSGKNRAQVDKKMIDDLRPHLEPDEILWLDQVAAENQGGSDEQVSKSI